MVLVWSRKRFREVDLSSEQQVPIVKPAACAPRRSKAVGSIVASVLTIALLSGLSWWIFGFPRGRREVLLSALTCLALALKDALARYLRPQEIR